MDELPSVLADLCVFACTKAMLGISPENPYFRPRKPSPFEKNFTRTDPGLLSFTRILSKTG